jgi:hypothetical protein
MFNTNGTVLCRVDILFAVSCYFIDILSYK